MRDIGKCCGLCGALEYGNASCPACHHQWSWHTPCAVCADVGAYVAALEQRYRSAMADATAATDPADQAYWYGMADAYADCAALLDPAHIMQGPVR